MSRADDQSVCPESAPLSCDGYCCPTEHPYCCGDGWCGASWSCGSGGACPPSAPLHCAEEDYCCSEDFPFCCGDGLCGASASCAGVGGGCAPTTPLSCDDGDYCCPDHRPYCCPDRRCGANAVCASSLPGFDALTTGEVEEASPDPTPASRCAVADRERTPVWWLATILLLVPRRRGARRRTVALASVLVSACLDGPSWVPDRGEPGGEAPGITSGAGDPVVPGTPPVATEPPGATESLGGADSTGDEPPSSFIMPNDWVSSFACDMFAQDCPPGEKCVPWATDGGTAWDATRCAPIVDDPGAEGDACTVADGTFSGLDDCGFGLVCWAVDERGEGHCEDICMGSADNPMCDDPNEVCPIAGNSAVVLCLDVCDPLAQDCSNEDLVCYPVHDHWVCAPDASGDAGTYGDPCEYINACDEGHVCIGAAGFTNCAGAVGCCSLVCNVEDREADAACAVLDPGQSCEAWYPERHAPLGYEAVGVCALPA